MHKRIIPCLDCDLREKEGRVVKGIEFHNIRYAGIPWELAEKYERDGADELVLLDITASHEKRETMTHVIRKVAEHISIPFTVGGGIRSLSSAERAFDAGADKISIGTAALENPNLIDQMTDQFGSESVVIAIDGKRRHNEEMWYECVIYGGRKLTNKNALECAMEAERRGGGEILLTSYDRDGTKDGYDLELTGAVSEKVEIPVIASGGCGSPAHISEVFEKTRSSAALAASIFHYAEYTIKETKEYLRARGIPVRL